MSSRPHGGSSVAGLDGMENFNAIFGVPLTLNEVCLGEVSMS
jgi:hypothetical protein